MTKDGAGSHVFIIIYDYYDTLFRRWYDELKWRLVKNDFRPKTSSGHHFVFQVDCLISSFVYRSASGARRLGWLYFKNQNTIFVFVFLLCNNRLTVIHLLFL